MLDEKYNGSGVGLFGAPQLECQPLTSCLPSPGYWLLGSLAPLSSKRGRKIPWVGWDWSHQAVRRMVGPLRRHREDDPINRYPRMLTLVFIRMDREKLDAIFFAGELINLPPTDVRHMYPISLSHL